MRRPISVYFSLYLFASGMAYRSLSLGWGVWLRHLDKYSGVMFLIFDRISFIIVINADEQLVAR